MVRVGGRAGYRGDDEEVFLTSYFSAPSQAQGPGGAGVLGREGGRLLAEAGVQGLEAQCSAPVRRASESPSPAAGS